MSVLELLVGRKLLFTAVGLVLIAFVSLTGAEVATITVSFITVLGGTFATIMGNRARKYEANLSKEETEIARMRADLSSQREINNKLRDRIEQLRDENMAVEKENLRLWVVGRQLQSQLYEQNIEPRAALERPTDL